MASITQNKFRVSVTVEGNDLGVWDTSTGGEVSSNVTVYNPGGGATQIALASTQTVGVVSMSRSYDLQRDHAIALKRLYAAVGGGVCNVKVVPLDGDGNAFGSPNTWSGVLSKVTPPPTDSNGTGAAMIAIEITPHGTPTAGGA